MNSWTNKRWEISLEVLNCPGFSKGDFGLAWVFLRSHQNSNSTGSFWIKNDLAEISGGTRGVHAKIHLLLCALSVFPCTCILYSQLHV